MFDLSVYPKNDRERIASMVEGGVKLGKVRQQLLHDVHVGLTFNQLEAKAQEYIALEGAVPSFSTVPGYHWATCLMANEALCHGIPSTYVIKTGDVITIDVGLIWQGYHVDSTVTTAVGAVSQKTIDFLTVGRVALKKAISKATAGNSVYDVSNAMEQTAAKGGAGLVEQLTGHGIGHKLHLPPNIPCRAYRADKRVRFTLGQTVAIEIMYTQGDPSLLVAEDGWTYKTKDGSLSAMYEETVLITPKGPLVLTQPTIDDIL